MSKPQEEKRKRQRVHAELPVHLMNARGFTRDVSAMGVFFWTVGAECACGQSIQFSVELSRPGGRFMLRCRGDVVRTEPCDRMVGVAVRIVESGIQLA